MTDHAATGSALTLLSVIIPARDEADNLGVTVEHLHLELRRHDMPHEIVVVDDGSTDATWSMLDRLAAAIPEVRGVRNDGPHGFGRAIVLGFDRSSAATPWSS